MIYLFQSLPFSPASFPDGIDIIGDLFGTALIRFDSSKSKSITISIRNNEVALESRQYNVSLDRNMAVDDKSTEVYYGDYAGLFGMLLLNVTDDDGRLWSYGMISHRV